MNQNKGLQAPAGSGLDSGRAAPSGEAGAGVAQVILASLDRWRVPLVELLAIAIWVVLLAPGFLIMSPQVVPGGREFLSAIQTHHVWNDFKACGACGLWNGYVRGGFPAFADPHGSMLHPIVLITTRLWGVINGAKVALLISFWFAGLGQWWTARILRLGWLPRMWSALLVVAGGHLASRMELGAFGVVLSTSMASLVFPAVLGVAMGRGRRHAVLLGLTMGSALLSGQGYMQIALLATMPALGFLVLGDSLRLRPIWRKFLLGGVLSILIAAPFLVPLAHFVPNFAKAQDPQFRVAQPLAYMPLNLVIKEWDFYTSDVLGKVAFPHLYVLYIGWVPVVLAVLGLALHRKEERRWIYYSIAAVLLLFAVASGVLLGWGRVLLPSLAGVRNPPQIAGLVVPLIVTLAAYGLHRLLQLSWPEIQIRYPGWPQLEAKRFRLAWLVILPLALNLRSAFDFAQVWLTTARKTEPVFALLEELETEGLQWVQPPHGRHYYIEPAISMGLKLSPGIMTWYWQGREMPTPVLEASPEGRPPEALEETDVIDGIPIYRMDARPYAYVDHGDGFSSCLATGRGGHLTVKCSTNRGGELIVQENMWTGWRAWIDGEPADLIRGPWLSVSAPAGAHDYTFRYRPWDAPLGVSLGFVGLGLSAYLWMQSKEEGEPH